MINRHCKQKYSIEYGYISVVDGVDECFICLSKDCGFRLKNLFSEYICMETERI